MPDSYFELVQRFPLRRVRTDAEHRQALAIVRELSRRGDARLDTGEGDYLGALATLVEQYERARWTIGKASPVDALRFLMEQHGLRAVDIGKLIGSQSAATMVLKGDRELSKSHIRKLAERFNVSPAVFI